MNEIFTAVYMRLSSTLSVDVFDHVPQDYNVFPYVRIDPLTNNNNDTDFETGFISTVQIIGFSQYKGSQEVALLNSDIYDALHRYALPDTLSFGISTIHQTFSTIALEPDGKTRQSIQRFTIIFEPLPA